jgi:FG-GAP-like repeat
VRDHRVLVVWMTMVFVFIASVGTWPFRHDESLHPSWPTSSSAQAAAVGSLTSAPTLAFTRHDVDSNPFGQVTEGFYVGDIDGDGRPDLVVGGDDYLVWYHNPDWRPNLIASGSAFGAGAMIVVRDIDGDGRLDVVSGAINASGQRQTVWYGNTPSGWAPHVLSNANYCHDLVFGDFNGDGRPDTACNDQYHSQIVWLQAPAVPAGLWTTHVIDPRRAMGADVADIDRDGHLDLIAGRAWYRNDGTGTFVRHPYTTMTDPADSFFNDYEKVNAVDLNGDGRTDIFATIFAESREGQVWAFLAPADPLNQPWTGVRIDPGPLFGVHSQAVARFDGSSRPQVMVGETNIAGFDIGPNSNPHVYVYRLLGSASDPAGWERTGVDHHGTHEAQAIDLNGDGLPDIAGTEENTDLLSPPRNGTVSWWQNVTATGPTRPTATTATSTTVVPASTSTSTTISGTTGTTLQRVLQPDASTGIDTYLTSPANPDGNWGNLPRAWLGMDEQNAQRPLLRFMLGRAPAGATVLGCTLTVHAAGVEAPLPGHVWRVTQPAWTEKGATWKRYDDTTPWTTPGGEVDAKSGIAFAPPVAPGAFAFPDLKVLCQDAIAARGGQLDLLIRQDAETPGTPRHQWSFVTSDDPASPALRPKLVVSFGSSASTPTSTTSTTTSITPTTTSPNIPACGPATTFSSVTCRVTGLGTRVEQEIAGDGLRTDLLATLQERVLGNVQLAEQFATGGDRSRARVRLARAGRGLRRFVRMLNSSRGRQAMPGSSGQPMKDEAQAIRKTLADLAASL